MEQTLDISWRTIVKILITGFVIYLLFVAHEIVIWFFFALVISVLLDPAVNFLRWLRIPKMLSVVLVYLSLLGAVGLLVYLTAPIFMFELNQFSQNIPMYFEKISPFLKEFGIQAGQSFQDFTAFLTSSLQQSSEGILRAVTTFFGGVFSTSMIFAIAFFISLEERGVERAIALLAPKRYEDMFVRLFERAQYKVSRWFGARILSCLFVGLVTFIAFYLLDVKYAFILALISAVLNFIPYIGPTITMVFAVFFVGVSSSWLLAAYVFVIVLVIQEIENKVLTPILMKKFMDLPPVLVLVSLLAGGVIFGFMGTLFAVPIFGILYEFTKEFLEKKKEDMV